MFGVSLSSHGFVCIRDLLRDVNDYLVAHDRRDVGQRRIQRVPFTGLVKCTYYGLWCVSYAVALCNIWYSR